MKAIVQFVVRQSHMATFLCAGFAFLQGIRVSEGLWQGVGLHGYIFEPGRAHMGHMVSVWKSFLQMTESIGLTAIFGMLAASKNHALKRAARQ